jgi:hypothetical protein
MPAPLALIGKITEYNITVAVTRLEGFLTVRWATEDFCLPPTLSEKPLQ